MRQFYAVLEEEGRLKAPENLDRAENRLAIRPFTVSVNCQIRGLTSIRKGQGKDHIPFLVDTNIIIASENVSGGVQVGNQGSFRKTIFAKPEGSQTGGVQTFPDSEGSKFFLIRRGPNPEGSYFC